MAKMNFKDALNKSLQVTKKYIDDAINTNSIVRPYEVFRVEETIFGKTGYIDVETMEPSVKYGLTEEYLDCNSFVFTVPTATTPYAIVCIGSSFQVSDLMVTEKWEGDPSKGEEGLYIIARGLNEDYKINIRHKESKDGVTVEVIRNTRYLHISNTKEFIPTGDYNPATKKYVDDQIAEKGFSGDYNDLENRPCYDDSIILFDIAPEDYTDEKGNTEFNTDYDLSSLSYEDIYFEFEGKEYPVVFEENDDGDLFRGEAGEISVFALFADGYLALFNSMFDTDQHIIIKVKKDIKQLDEKFIPFETEEETFYRLLEAGLILGSVELEDGSILTDNDGNSIIF